MTASPDLMFDAAWLQSRFPTRPIHWFPTIGSTMIEASRLAAQGCPNGTVVLADEQTAGQGRLGRSWHSAPGQGLYLTLVLRLPFPAEAFPSLTLALGLATREAVLESTAVACDLRWPNDLLAASRKCAGILVRAESGAVIAGIGINVNHTAFPEHLAPHATSLALVTGATHAREPLAAVLLQSVDRWTQQIANHGISTVLTAFRHASSYVEGLAVETESGIRGVTAGLDQYGFLLVRQNNGEVARIVAGGVRPS